MEHWIREHRNLSFHRAFSCCCSDTGYCLYLSLFAELDWAIQCQCWCSLIPLIIEGEFICLLCWQVNGCSAICLHCSLASVVLPTFHAWLIGRALEGRLQRLQGHMLRKCLPKNFNMALRWRCGKISSLSQHTLISFQAETKWLCHCCFVMSLYPVFSHVTE